MRVPIKQAELASLALLPADGSGVLYDPSFNLNQGTVGMPVFTVFGNSLLLSPETLQLSSEGQYVTAVIESANGKAVAIQPGTIKLEVNGSELTPATNHGGPELGDEDLDLNPDLTVKFNRKTFQTRIPRGANSVLVTARWTFTDGTTGFTSSEIRVIE
jgi:hypothetical protein